MNSTYFNPVKIICTDKFWEMTTKEYECDDWSDILVVCSERFKNSEHFTEISGANIEIYHPPKGNPIKQNMDEAAKHFSSHKYDIIVAIGGGAIMDFAKIIRYRHLIDSDLICIPTNFGSSSELTPWATIWDYESNKKLSEQTGFAETAIYDMRLMQSMDIQNRIIGGLDILSHSIDSATNKKRNYISYSYTIAAITLTLTGLACVEDKEQSIKLLNAANTYAGLAFSNTATSLSHAISYPLTLRYNIPHGIAAGITLRKIMNKFQISMLQAFDKKVVPIIRKHIPFSLRCYGIKPSDIPSIAKEAFSNPRINNFMYPINEDEIANILMESY